MKEALISLLLLVIIGCNKPSQKSNISPYITSKLNQTISSFPHEIDFFAPNNATSAIIFLHGGGGKKERFAHHLGITTGI